MKTLRVLIQHVLGPKVKCISRVQDGCGNLTKLERIRGKVKHLLETESDLGGVLLFVDSECTPAEVTQAKIDDVEAALRKAVDPDCLLRYVAVVHAIEGWLLADPQAVEAFVGVHKKVKVPANASAECRPKQVLQKLLKKSKKRYVPTAHNHRIADKLRIDEASRRSKSFRAFRDLLESL